MVSLPGFFKHDSLASVVALVMASGGAATTASPRAQTRQDAPPGQTRAAETQQRPSPDVKSGADKKLDEIDRRLQRVMRSICKGC